MTKKSAKTISVILLIIGISISIFLFVPAKIYPYVYEEVINHARMAFGFLTLILTIGFSALIRSAGKED